MAAKKTVRERVDHLLALGVRNRWWCILPIGDDPGPAGVDDPAGRQARRLARRDRQGQRRRRPLPAPRRAAVNGAFDRWAPDLPLSRRPGRWRWARARGARLPRVQFGRAAADQGLPGDRALSGRVGVLRRRGPARAAAARAPGRIHLGRMDGVHRLQYVAWQLPIRVRQPPRHHAPAVPPRRFIHARLRRKVRRRPDQGDQQRLHRLAQGGHRQQRRRDAVRRCGRILHPGRACSFRPAAVRVDS